MRIVLRMPGKSRGGRKGDANLSPRLSSHAQIRPHTCENVEVQRREVNTSGRKPRFRPLASRLYLHSRKLSPPCTHRAVQLFAFLVLIRRRCYAGKGVHFPFETPSSTTASPSSSSSSSSRFRQKRDRAEREQWLWQNNEAQAVAPLKTRLMRPSRLNGGSLPGDSFLLFTPLPLLSSLSSS